MEVSIIDAWVTFVDIITRIFDYFLLASLLFIAYYIIKRQAIEHRAEVAVLRTKIAKLEEENLELTWNIGNSKKCYP